MCERVAGMDPNANLRDQEALLQLPKLQSYQRDRLHELRVALRDWIRRGGFEPDWANCPKASDYYHKHGRRVS